MPAILVALIIYFGVSVVVSAVVMAAIVVGSRFDTELMLGEALVPQSRVPAAAPTARHERAGHGNRTSA